MKIIIEIYAASTEFAATAIANALAGMALADPPAASPIVVNGVEVGRITLE